jgi:two-component system alkaline phosphatase synthesis response regulator PhoP
MPVQGGQTIIGSISALPQSVIGIGGKRPKILIVLESKAILMLFKAQMQQAGYDVSFVMNSLEAPAAINNEKPDIIILGVELSQLSGPDLCRMIKTKPELAQFSRTPVLLYSAMSEEELDSKVKECQADGYIHKTWNMERVTKVLSPYVQK